MIENTALIKTHLKMLVGMVKVMMKSFFWSDSIISSLVSGFLVEDLLSKYKIIEYTKSGCYPIYSVCQFQDNLNYQLEVEGFKSKKIIFGGDFNTETTSIKNLEKTLMMLLDNKNEVFYWLDSKTRK